MTRTTLHAVSRLPGGWGRDGIVLSQRRKITVSTACPLEVLCGSAA